MHTRALRLLRTTALGAALLGAPAVAAAQTQVGMAAGYNFRFEAPIVNLQARIPMASLPLVLKPSLEYTFQDPVFGEDVVQIGGNLDVLYRIPLGPVVPYVGAGANVTYFGGGLYDGGYQGAANLLAGVQLPRTSGLTTFAQVRAQAGDPVGLSASVGVLF